MMKTSPLRRRTRLRAGAPLRKRRKTRKGQIPEAVLDALWSQLITLRGECVWFVHPDGQGVCAGPIQAAHIYSRTYRQIRWAEENGLPMCAAHHFFAHRNP